MCATVCLPLLLYSIALKKKSLLCSVLGLQQKAYTLTFALAASRVSFKKKKDGLAFGWASPTSFWPHSAVLISASSGSY